MITCFGSLMDIDRLIPFKKCVIMNFRFGSLMDIDRLIPPPRSLNSLSSFGSLMDIDRLILKLPLQVCYCVLVL